MGLIETLERGIVLGTKTTPSGLITLPAGQSQHSASVDVFGGTFVLLGMSAQRDCRVRLYTDKQSMDIDAPRAEGDFAIDDAVGLVSDVVITTATMSLNFNPPLLGSSHELGNAWYKITGSIGSDNLITFTYFPLTDAGDATTDRSALIVSGASLPTTGNGISGSIATPKSFLILTGSANVETRLRLYSAPIDEVPLDEQARAFGALPSSSAKLIADMMFDSASYAYKLSPILEAYTWQNNLYSVGTNVASYIMKNESGGVSDVTASLHIFAVED